MELHRTRAPQTQDHREFSRIDAELPMAIRRVSEDEEGSIQSRLASPRLPLDEPLPLEVRDPALAEWLRFLNKKMDAVIRMLAEREDVASGLPICSVNISAGGLCFRPHEPLSVGDMLETKVRLPLNPPVTLLLYGIVVETEEESVCIQYVDISDEIRDIIVRFVFQQQREILRSQRKD
ncbi:MAG: type IV pilus assembly protein PilZ [Nitrospirae bacterium]|nr:MAG: type IV pilus assembly protein PilZ [Nitrospirota bacterium]HSW40398.1 PilZ domain-containing protein [Acidobacteriota bacterium]